MSGTVTFSWIAVIGVFAFGIVVGWLIAKHLRVQVSANVGVSGDRKLAGTARIIRKTVTRNLTLKCQCGAVWKFADGDVSVPPGSEPLPSGDSFTCRNCGRSIDLEGEKEAFAKFQ